jgi:hypothetical protein
MIGAPTTAAAGAVHDYYRLSFGTTYFLNRASFVTGDGTNGKFGWVTAMSPDASNIVVGTNNNSTLAKFYYQSFNVSGKLLAGSVLGQTKKVSISTFTALTAGAPVAKYDLYTIVPAAINTIARDSANRDISVIRFENRGAYANLLYDTNSSKWLIQESSGVTLY